MIRSKSFQVLYAQRYIILEESQFATQTKNKRI